MGGKTVGVGGGREEEKETPFIRRTHEYIHAYRRFAPYRDAVVMGMGMVCTGAVVVDGGGWR